MPLGKRFPIPEVAKSFQRTLKGSAQTSDEEGVRKSVPIASSTP